MGNKQRLDQQTVYSVTYPRSNGYRPNDPPVHKVPHISSVSMPSCRPEGIDHSRPKQRRSSQRKTLDAVILLVLLFGLIYAVYHIAVYGINTASALHDEQRIQGLILENEPVQIESAEVPSTNTGAIVSASPMPNPTPVAQTPFAAGYPDGNATTAKPEVLIQFHQVTDINPDTVGQLRVGEAIDTYVVQRDNTYYLRHSFYGEYSLSGAIFLDVSSSIYPQSRNLIIHGHNMKNGTSFGKLTRFKDIEYLNQYPVIHFASLYEAADYLPFAIVYFSIDPKSEAYLNLYQVNYLSDDDFLEFVKTVKTRSLYHLYANVGKASKIITLTTCATDDPNMRFALFAVKKVL